MRLTLVVSLERRRRGREGSSHEPGAATLVIARQALASWRTFFALADTLLERTTTGELVLAPAPPTPGLGESTVKESSFTPALASNARATLCTCMTTTRTTSTPRSVET